MAVGGWRLEVGGWRGGQGVLGGDQTDQTDRTAQREFFEDGVEIPARVMGPAWKATEAQALAATGQSPKAIPAWGTRPQVFRLVQEYRAESPFHDFVPDIPFIEISRILFQEGPEFFLKAAGAVARGKVWGNLAQGSAGIQSPARDWRAIASGFGSTWLFDEQGLGHGIGVAYRGLLAKFGGLCLKIGHRRQLLIVF